MAHLAARLCFGLAVKVQFGIWLGQNCLPVIDVITQKVLHGPWNDGPDRPAAGRKQPG